AMRTARPRGTSSTRSSMICSPATVPLVFPKTRQETRGRDRDREGWSRLRFTSLSHVSLSPALGGQRRPFAHPTVLPPALLPRACCLCPPLLLPFQARVHVPSWNNCDDTQFSLVVIEDESILRSVRECRQTRAICIQRIGALKGH